MVLLLSRPGPQNGTGASGAGGSKAGGSGDGGDSGGGGGDGIFIIYKSTTSHSSFGLNLSPFQSFITE